MHFEAQHDNTYLGWSYQDEVNISEENKHDFENFVTKANRYFQTPVKGT